MAIVTKEDRTVIGRIADRAEEMGLAKHGRKAVEDSLEIAHSQLTLRLNDLLGASDKDFKKDIEGIQKHTDILAKCIKDYYRPEYGKVTTKEEYEVIDKIAERAISSSLAVSDKATLVMDIENAHKYFNLELNDLLKASRYEFSHDLVGIQESIDRERMIFDGIFVPLFAQVNI